MRGRKAIVNTIFALIREMVAVVCGLILPRLILSYYGSTYNGLVSSIEQFLAYGALLQSGIAGATRAALYKPLEQHNEVKISQIYTATRQFIYKVTLIFGGIVFLLAIIYPFCISENFSWWFTSSLIVILSINAFSNYFLGVTYKAILAADQKQYIITISYIACTVLSTVVSSLLVFYGCTIHMVKMASALAFLLQPFIMRIIVIKNYNINEKAKPDNNAISQRWDSFAHQIANFVHDNTDIVILTLFTNLKEVSVYTVYRMVMNGIKAIVNSMASGIEAAFGNMIARKEQKSLNHSLDLFEFVIFYLSGFVFSCAIVLVIPFISIYTKGIEDINYNRPLFGVLFSIAELLWCIRIPYQIIVQAAGHYKQTKTGAVIELTINIVLSLIFVYKFEIVGVTVGTIVAMSFRTIQYAVYASKNILFRDIKWFLRRMTILLLQMVSGCLISIHIGFECFDYSSWIGLAFIRAAIIAAISIIWAIILDRKLMKNVLYKVFRTKEWRRKRNV